MAYNPDFQQLFPGSEEDYIGLPPDSTGKKMRTRLWIIFDPVVGAYNYEEAEVVHLGDPNAPNNLAYVSNLGELHVDPYQQRAMQEEIFLTQFDRRYTEDVVKVQKAREYLRTGTSIRR
jgi:hypothetical protein